MALRVQSLDWSLSVALRPLRSTCQQKGLVGSGKVVASDQLPVTSKNPADVNGDGVVNQF